MKKFIFLFLILISCNTTEKKETLKIEIYLTKNRIESHHGVELENSNLDSFEILRLQERWGKKQMRLDTLTSELILAGAFKGKKRDLKNEPFINSHEIISFNKNTGQLTLDKVATKKLSDLKFDSFGQQFILTINGEPQISGYFYPAAYSFGSNTYHYQYLSNSEISELELYNGLELRKVDIKKEFPDLYKALDGK